MACILDFWVPCISASVLSHLKYLYWLYSDVVLFFGVSSLKFPRLFMDKPVSLLLFSLVAKSLTFVFYILPLIHQAGCRKPFSSVTGGGTIGPVCSSIFVRATQLPNPFSLPHSEGVQGGGCMDLALGHWGAVDLAERPSSAVFLWRTSCWSSEADSRSQVPLMPSDLICFLLFLPLPSHKGPTSEISVLLERKMGFSSCNPHSWDTGHAFHLLLRAASSCAVSPWGGECFCVQTVSLSCWNLPLRQAVLPRSHRWVPAQVRTFQAPPRPTPGPLWWVRVGKLHWLPGTCNPHWGLVCWFLSAQVGRGLPRFFGIDVEGPEHIATM